MIKRITGFDVVRLIAFAVALSSLMFTAQAQACTLMVPTAKPGETLAQADYRLQIGSQRWSWNEADTVYLGRVAKSNGKGWVEVQPIYTLRGRSPPRRVNMRAEAGPCGLGPEWKAGDTVVVFAHQIGWRDNLWRAGQWIVFDAYRRGEIVDATILTALCAVESARR